MALIYTIDKFAVDGTDKLVGFKVDSNGSILIIDKKVPIVEGKTDASYITDAQALAQTEIDAWVVEETAQTANVGKVWNPDTSTLE
tara:strand:- start:85 stop:342 length:258 start_codon:yes stop_codon:yes gene_type:complete